MILLKFFYVDIDKIPIRLLRKEKAFVNEKVPRIFALPIRNEKEKSRKPAEGLWNDLRPKEFPVWTYPNIDPQAWFTYAKNSEGKVKRVALDEYLNRR